MEALRPEVAEFFELTSHTTRLHVPRLGHDVDLTLIGLEEAAQLVALEGGFDWLRRKEPPGAPVANEMSANDAGAMVKTTAPARTKRKKRA